MKITDRTASANNFRESQNLPREDNLGERVRPLNSSISRRSFLGTSLAVGAGTMGAGLLAKTLAAQVDDPNSRGGLTRGDADILRFLAAAEIIETDLWPAYNQPHR